MTARRPTRRRPIAARRLRASRRRVAGVRRAARLVRGAGRHCVAAVRQPRRARSARRSDPRGAGRDASSRAGRGGSAPWALHDVILLDHRTGSCRGCRRDVLDADIRAAIVRLHPDVVITFDEDGLYWHPDHIAVHERTTAAVASLGEAAPALFYVSMPPGSMRGVLSAAAAEAHPDTPMPQRVLGIDEADAFGLFAARPTLVIDAGEFAATSWRRCAAIARRLPATRLDRLPADEAARLLGVEHYRRADVGAQGEAFIERLGPRGELMDENLLDLLRCPFCGSRLQSRRERRAGALEGRLESGVLGCECCAFPIVAGIPVLLADDVTRTAMHALEAGTHEEALLTLLGLDEPERAESFRALLARGDRHLSRRDRRAQPRPRGHLLRLSLLRSDLRHGRNGPAIARPAARRVPGPGARSLRRLRPPDARALRPPARATTCSSPTCSSGSCGWPAASRRRARRRCAATPTSRCRLPAASFRWSCCRTRSPTSGTSVCSPTR